MMGWFNKPDKQIGREEFSSNTRQGAMDKMNNWRRDNQERADIISIQESERLGSFNIVVFFKVIAIVFVLFVIANHLLGGWLGYGLWASIFG